MSLHVLLMIQYLREELSQVEQDGAALMFKFDQPNGTIQLCLDTPLQSGWTVHPDREPMKVCLVTYNIVVSLDYVIDTTVCS